MEERRRPLRVGVLTNGTSVPRWQADILRLIAELPDVEVPIVIMNGEKLGGRRWRRFLELRRYKNIPFRLFSMLDALQSLCGLPTGYRRTRRRLETRLAVRRVPHGYPRDEPARPLPSVLAG
jgi:hypothetical protein